MKCPYCAEEVKEYALKCKHCGEWFKKQAKIPIKKENSNSHKIDGSDYGKLILKVDDSFQLYDNIFLYCGKPYTYEGIIGVDFIGTHSTINLAHIGSASILIIEHKERDIIKIESEAWLFRTSRFKKIKEAADLISSLSYRGRLNKRVDELKTNGFISYACGFETIKIYINGDVTNGKKTFNLRKAYNNKSLQIGYDFQWGAERASDPHEVIVSDTGTAMWNEKIKFSITEDYDVMHTLLRKLAGIKSS